MVHEKVKTMKIIDVARKYIGQKELAGNKFDDNTELGKRLHAAGQKDGEAWCSYFGEAVCTESYPDKAKDIQKLFSASAVATFKNFVAADYTVVTVPMLGALVIWRRYENGKPMWQGHFGIVTEVTANGFKSVEGNSNAQGSRDSDSVIENVRTEKYSPNGLTIMGFIILGFET